MTSITMNTLRKLVFLFLPLFVLFAFHPFPAAMAQQDSVSATPTYDPLAEPPLPENPTEFELGRNLYWHWCMTCHGDKGQGLTDEFRSIWDEDHQNCWGRGCHAGHNGDMVFPIPTVIPALVDETHLAQFASVRDLSAFLKRTHPPQSPGILKDEEYQAIALFVFTMNSRSPDIPTSTVTPVLLPTVIMTAVISATKTTQSYVFPISAAVILIVGLAILFFRARRNAA